jgi:hypothetical protein
MLATTATTDAEANKTAMAQAHAALTMAPAYTHAISVLSQPAVVATPLKNSSPEVAQMEVDDDSAMLRTPNTGEPQHSFVSPSPMSLQVIPSPLTVPAGFTSIAGDVPAASATTTSVTDASPLPKSMREIYKISNENRRMKKKVKTTAGGSQSASHSGMEGDEEETNSANASTNNSRPSSVAGMRKEAGGKKGHAANNSSIGMDTSTDGTSSSQEFMKNIGWGSGTPPISSASHTSNAAMQLLNNQQPNSAKSSANNRQCTENRASDWRGWSFAVVLMLLLLSLCLFSYGDSKRKHSSAPPSGSASLSSSPPSSSPAFHSFDYTHATLPPSNPAAQAYFNPYTDMGRDKSELKAAAGTSGPTTAANKIYKGHTQLKTSNKSVTVRMDEGYQRQRGGSAGSGIPIPRSNAQQQQQQRR